MEQNRAVHAFATLGHPGRLAVFRLLMRFAPQGVRPTEIAAALGLKANTLSHHLADLSACGLVQVERRGRSLLYAVDLDMAEALLRDLGRGKFRAHSAGTRPNTQLNPFALEVLSRNGHDISGLRAKHILEFQRPEAPVMDFVFTVCDTAAAEECPPWPGQPITGHWGLPDPVKASGTGAEKALVFAQTYAALRRRIAAFVELPFASLSRISLQARVDAIGADAATAEKG